MKKTKTIFKTLIILCLVLNIGFAQKATVKETKESFKTYPFSDPNPVVRMNNIYPYFRFDGYSSKSVNKEWKIVTMENKYIKLFILPEIGGKVWGAVEKATGKEFIYYNKVVKFRDIAMRGAWTSGGIEFNFGDFGHAPTVATPVDYYFVENEDGSASCFIGSLDLPSRTEWYVEIKLQKDKAFFETHSFWYNPTELNTSLYNWSNAAIEASNDLQYFYPGKNYINHDGNLFSYPVNEKGIDISIYGNNNFGSYKSYHVTGEYTDYFGTIWKGNNFGMVHHSLYSEKPGKKIWIWGLSREGEIWKDLLTDPELGNKQYSEIQSGLLFNQAGPVSSNSPFKHSFFTPNNCERFSEIWYPVKGLDNIVDANGYGALSYVKRNNSIKFGVCPAQSINSEIYVTVNGKNVYKRNLKLEPLQVFNDNIVVEESGDVEISFENKMLSYSSKTNKTLNRPNTINNKYESNSVYGLYTAGIELDRQRNSKTALEKYLACLEKDPAFLPALTGAAEIYYKKMEYNKSLDYVKQALSIDAYDPKANFIYGIVNRKLGNKYDAMDGFGFAAKSLEYRSAAYSQLAEMSFVEKDYTRSIEYATKSLDYNRFNTNSSKIIELCFRKQKRGEDALRFLDWMYNPINHFNRFEKYLLYQKSNFLDDFKSQIKNELPHETYLELGIYYFNLGLSEEAQQVFENSPNHPIVNFWLAYIYDKNGDIQKSLSSLEKALAASPKLVFPFRRETAEVLEWAMTKSSNWKIKYYLALIYWNINRIELAEKLLQECGENPDFAPFYLSRAMFYKTNSPAQNDNIIIDYRKALELDKKDWRACHILSDYLIGISKFEMALSNAKIGAKQFRDSYILQFDYAKALLYNGEFGDCLDIMNKINILPYEGARDGREVYWKANLLFAVEYFKKGSYKKSIEFIQKSRLWPENLGVGKPYDVDTRLEDYLEALCQEKSGNKNACSALMNGIIEYTNTNFKNFTPNSLLGALALKNMGKVYEANKMMDEWQGKDPDNSFVNWCVSKFNSDNTKADEIFKKSGANNNINPATLKGNDFYLKLYEEILK
jgi:Tfp pilus assembly protein PilF